LDAAQRPNKHSSLFNHGFDVFETIQTKERSLENIHTASDCFSKDSREASPCEGGRSFWDSMYLEGRVRENIDSKMWFSYDLSFETPGLQLHSIQLDVFWILIYPGEEAEENIVRGS
jgi:hypothetical protein